MIGDVNIFLVYSNDYVYVYENEALLNVHLRDFFEECDLLDYLLGKRLYSYRVFSVDVGEMVSVNSFSDVLKKYSTIENYVGEL